MTTTGSAEQIIDTFTGSVVVGSDGEEIGAVEQVYTDNETGRPSWVTVTTGWFGTKESFVPLDDADIDGATIRVPFDKATIKGAPHNDAGAPLSETDEQELHDYYQSARAGRVGTTTAQATGETDSAATHVGTGEFLTRSEEQLHVGTEKVQTGRARLRKVVVTEQQTVTVPVTREEVRVVREPIGAGDTVDTTIGEAAADIVLTEERIVVSKETVPVEKVRLDTETITEQQQVTETVRKEQIEFDDDVAPQVR